MHTIYILSVCLHILAAMIWMGGMLFLVLVVVPWLRSGGRAQAGTFLHETGKRFRLVGWLCFAILTITGSFNLWVRGVRLADFISAEWISSAYGQIISLKLALFVMVLIVSFVHDFYIGPAATRAMASGPGSAESLKLRRRASLLGRLNVLFSLVIVALAVMIVRGVPG